MDGHTVLRFVSDIYTDTILRFAKTINSQTKSIFHSYKNKSPPRGSPAAVMAARNRSGSDVSTTFDINPRRIEWHMTEELSQGIRFAETRLSDLILQNEVKVLEFTNYGKYFITDMKMSPDAFVQVSDVPSSVQPLPTNTSFFFYYYFRWPSRQHITVFMANSNVLMNQQ